MGVKVFKEITSGASANLSLNSSGGGGGSSLSSGLRYQRAWKFVFDEPGDIIGTDVRDHIGVTVGSPHPTDLFCVCDSIDVKPDGDSRHVYIVSASYSSMALSLEQGGLDDQNQDPRTQSPDARKANWSTETSAIEAPSWLWKPITANAPGAGGWCLAVNPVGDLYDGVATMQPIVTIRVEQTQARDPTQWSLYVGYVNSNAFRIGSLNCAERSVMLKGTSAAPHIETVGKKRWRGWKATYEFVYKPGYNSYLNQFLGWDVAIPVSGFNIRNVAGAFGRNDVEKGALSLEMSNDDVGSIKNWPNAAIEPTLVGKKTRANVLISAPRSKATQRPSAQPVALNWDGTPRNDELPANQRVLIQRNQIYMDFDMRNIGIRLD